MKNHLRVWGVDLRFAIAVGALFFASAVVWSAQVTIELDKVSPSGGSGLPMIPTGGGTITVNVATTEAPPAPQSGVPIESPTPLTPTASLTFTGVVESPGSDGGFIYKPPDTHAAVGPGAGAAGRVVEVTNTGIQIFDKTGSSVAAATDLDAFLTALGAAGLTGSGVTNLAFDPKVIYDQHSGRFFVVILDGRTPTVRSNIHICTSKTSTPSTLTSTDWTVETSSALTSYSGTDTWFDYPCIGADSTRLIVTGNMFTLGGVFTAEKIRVFDKSTLTDDGAPAGTTFNDIDDTSGAGTVQPAHVFGSTLNGDFYLVDRLSSAFYGLWQITGAGGAATLVSGTYSAVAWTAGASLTGAPQLVDGLNADPTISTLSPRVMNAVYRDSVGNPDSFWCCLTSDIDADSRTEVVWFQIDPNSTNSAVAGVITTPTLLQSGFIDGSAVAGWSFMPSISVNTLGDAMICYSDSDASKAVDMRVVARDVGDTAGTFQSSVVIASGAGEYDDFSTTFPERWGDYSACFLDPDDDTTFWVANEVCETAVSAGGDDAEWGTRIAKMGAVVPIELSEFLIE